MTNPDEAVTTVYLIRRGRTDLNRAGRLRGRVDAPLDEVGRAEADRLAALFAGVKLAAVLTSPVQRTVQTAVPLAASTNAPLRRVMAFLDRDYGPWNGRLKAEVERSYGSLEMAPGVEARRRSSAAFWPGYKRLPRSTPAWHASSSPTTRSTVRCWHGSTDASATPSWCPSGSAAGTGCGGLKVVGGFWWSTDGHYPD